MIDTYFIWDRIIRYKRKFTVLIQPVAIHCSVDSGSQMWWAHLEDTQWILHVVLCSFSLAQAASVHCCYSQGGAVVLTTDDCFLLVLRTGWGNKYSNPLYLQVLCLQIQPTTDWKYLKKNCICFKHVTDFYSCHHFLTIQDNSYFHSLHIVLGTKKYRDDFKYTRECA
jgi:hypothetical protein